MKGNSSLAFVKRNLFACSEETKCTAYVSLVRPHLEYASAVWDAYRQNVVKLEAIQNRAVRFIKRNYSYDTSVSDFKNFLSLGLLSEKRKNSIVHKFSINLCIIILLCLFRHTIYCLLGKLQITPRLHLFNHLYIMITICIVFFLRTIRD